MDNTMDTTLDGQWLTYAELAKARGIDRQSAVRLVIRHGWRRQKGNEGREIKVLVPPEAISPDETIDRSGEVSSDINRLAAIAKLTETFDFALAALREAHLGEVAGLKVRIEDGERALIELRDIHARELATVQADLYSAREAGRIAEAALAEAKAAEEARNTRTRWQRLRQAWRGV